MAYAPMMLFFIFNKNKIIFTATHSSFEDTGSLSDQLSEQTERKNVQTVFACDGKLVPQEKHQAGLVFCTTWNNMLNLFLISHPQLTFE